MLTVGNKNIIFLTVLFLFLFIAYFMLQENYIKSSEKNYTGSIINEIQLL